MREFLMPLLECPECRTNTLTLESKKVNEGNIISGRITCSCGAIYPIINGIPRFLNCFRIDLSSGKNVKYNQVQKRFEYQWKKWGRDEVLFGRTKEESKKFFLDFSGSKIDHEYLEGKFALDAGCGHGRFTEIMVEFGAYSVGLDIGDGVEIARDKVMGHSNA